MKRRFHLRIPTVAKPDVEWKAGKIILRGEMLLKVERLAEEQGLTVEEYTNKLIARDADPL